MISLVLWMAIGFPGLSPQVEDVEPTDLIRRPDLVGREIVVDDRIRYFQESRRNQGYDQFLMKRSEIVFRLPPRLKFNHPPSEPNARVTGAIVLEEGRRVFVVSQIELLPKDMDRLEREIARLRAGDYQGRRGWAEWAERRGKELADAKLEARGIELEGDALWLEAQGEGVDPLEVVERSASRPIPAPIRNALLHQGFRDRLTRIKTSEEAEALAKRIETSLPASLDATALKGTLTDQLSAYAKDPASTYREAQEPVRAAWDRHLLADLIQKSLELQVATRPGEASKLADLARSRLPDRPEFADRLRRRALDEAEAHATTMRQSEVEALARQFREGGDEDRSRRLLENWLADRRKNRLSESDAEGRILLAASYEKLLADRRVAAELLREALVIDPQSRSAVDSFLRMGFRKGDNGWYDPTTTSVAGDRQAEVDRGKAAETGDSLVGLTKAQVRSRLGGKPDLVVRSASQGRCVEQWIYKNGRGIQVVRFVIEPTTPEPRASAHFSEKN